MVEAETQVRDGHRAVAVVADDHAGRAEHRARRERRPEVERHAQIAGEDGRRAGPRGQHEPNFVAVLGAPGVHEDQLREGRPGLHS